MFYFLMLEIEAEDETEEERKGIGRRFEGFCEKMKKNIVIGIVAVAVTGYVGWKIFEYFKKKEGIEMEFKEEEKLLEDDDLMSEDSFDEFSKFFDDFEMEEVE
ncbi:CLUMA_CG004334, isoform A [Clunio marinus]|uniref:CLUMA_CG004334, isoform A n=1 Tax=Clunio marinus TaxID=568069 RepID=A0A1J1HRD0_9DIPT|nr:CLUMA_CG004334, isoform A [Clunio marinus]